MVRIITDSAADFEPHEYEQMKVMCIPICVSLGNTEYQENVDLSKDLFYQLLEETDVSPRTAQPSPHTVECLLKDAMEADDEAVVISLSSGFSGLFQSMIAVKNLLEYKNCYIIDSLTGTGGQRMLVEQAVRLRDGGKTACEIVEYIEALRSRIVLYACMNTLEYLHRGGRISTTAYKVGSFANVKPIITIDQNGYIQIPSKAIGIRKGMDYMCRQLEGKKQDENYPLYVMFTGNCENGEILAQRLRSMGYSIPNERVINVGAAIGSHIGPNSCGLVYISEVENN